jgi:hypothetical protein
MSENSQDYAQKLQRDFMFMNSAYVLVYLFLSPLKSVMGRWGEEGETAKIRVTTMEKIMRRKPR